jgi:hypothetical protein
MRSARVLWWLGLVGVAVALAQEPKAPPPPGLPGTPGVYVEASAGQWKPLPETEVRDSSIKRMDVFLDTGGMLPLDMTCVYPGPAAALRLVARHPVFFVRGIRNPREALIARLTTKKDSRTLRTRSTEAGAGNKAGINKSDTRRVTVVALEGGVYSLTPVEALKPGEYLLTFGLATSGYDFGIQGQSPD